MEAIELTIDGYLLAEVDRVTRSLAMTRADFTRIALEFAVEQGNNLD